MRILKAYLDTFVTIAHDSGAFLILLVAPVFYSFLYPFPYRDELVTSVPVAVVDQDASALSRLVVRYVAANPRLHIAVFGTNAAQARNALTRGDVYGALLLPAGLQRDVLQRKSAHPSVLGNGALFLMNSTVLGAFSESLLAASQAFAPPRQRSPVIFELRRLFNPQAGYANYVVPAVAILIIHQTLVIGIGLLLATRRERREGPVPYPPAQFLGEALAFATIGFAGALNFCGFFDWFWDYPGGGNLACMLAFAALFGTAVALFGMALGSLFDRRERALQVWVFTSILLLFVSGYPWPAEALPAALRALRWTVPSTAGILGFTKIVQMHADWNEVRPEVLALALTIAFFALPAWLGIRRGLARAHPPSVPPA